MFDSVENGNEESLRKVFSENINVNTIDRRNQNTFLHYSVRANKLEWVKKLVDKGANINHTNHLLQRPIDVAAMHGHAEILKYFLNLKRIDINEVDRDGYTVLRWAEECLQIECAKILKEQGATNPHKS